MEIKRLSTPPIVLYDNLFFDDRANLSMGTEAADWRLGSKWQGSSAANMDTGALSSRPVNCMAIAAHSLSTNGYSAELYGSTDGVSYSLIASITPEDNEAKLLVFPTVEYAYYRMRIAGGSGAWAVGVVAAGVWYALPKSPTDLSPYARGYRNEQPETRYGTPLPSTPRPTPSTIPYEITALDRSQARPGSPLHSFFDSVTYPGGRPFFMQWDRHGDDADQIWFCKIQSGFEFAPKVKPGVPYVEPFTIPIVKMQEA